jgi:uncharacterized protein (TIGR01370 family)
MSTGQAGSRALRLGLVVLTSLQLGCGICADLAGQTATELRQSATPTRSPSGVTPGPLLSEGGLDKWALWTGSTQLRGANIYQRRVYPELDGLEFLGPGPIGPPYTQADFDRLSTLGANYVNVSHPGLFEENPPYEVNEEAQANLDNLLSMIGRADMFAVISFRTGPGRSEFTFLLDDLGEWFDDSYLNDDIWQSEAAQTAWIAMWRHTAERYRDNSVVVGYDLMVEPNANEVWLDLWDQDEFCAEYAGSLLDWNELHPRITAAIREVDASTPILIGGMGYSAVDWLPLVEPTGDARTVYTAHQYAPHSYTHQQLSLDQTYPGRLDTDWDGQEEEFDREWLDELLGTVDEFVATHGAPVAVNEFGVARWQPGAAQFLDDQMGLFEERGLNYALWTWDPAWEPWASQVDAFNFRHGADPDVHVDIEPNALIDVITSYWSLNTARPSTLAASAGTRARLSEVDQWLYVLDVDLQGPLVDQVAASSYDLVVIDFVPSQQGEADFPMADLTGELHSGAQPKLVLAYISIAEAEDYRSYWQTDWRVGDPEWIAGDDPDGWEGNFPVAYWHEDWREIWLGRDGYLSAIIEAGFDGVYLDWVEAYSEESVAALAIGDGVDPFREMVRWVTDIAGFCRASRPGFIVVAQNGAELTIEEDYLSAIDGLAQEHIWFDGGEDNEPPGDCPLPRRPADVDSDAYRSSLSAECRRAFDADPEGTLHTSSEEYLDDLIPLRGAGMVVLTVDYAMDPENVAWVCEVSRELGFVPFLSSRALDRYVEPLP